MKIFKKTQINPLYLKRKYRVKVENFNRYLKRKYRVKVENFNRKNHSFEMKKVVKIGDLGRLK